MFVLDHVFMVPINQIYLSMSVYGIAEFNLPFHNYQPFTNLNSLFMYNSVSEFVPYAYRTDLYRSINEPSTDRTELEQFDNKIYRKDLMGPHRTVFIL